MENENQFQIAAFGVLHLEEPVSGAQDLKPGAYFAAVGSRLTVKEGVAGLLLLGSDVGMRLDTGAEVTVDADGTALDRGRIWVHSGSRHADFRIDAGIAQVQTGGGICMVVREPRGCAVIALDGPIQARARTGQSVRLQSGQQVWFDPDQGPSQLQKVPFLGTATSWMTQLILLQQDDSELRERILAMVGAYEDGDFRDAAAVEIRKLGARCVPMLVRAVQEHADDREFGRRTAALVGDLLDYGYARHVLPLLKAADPEIRVLTFRALQRSTGTAERDEAFWRDADEPARGAAIRAWYERL